MIFTIWNLMLWILQGMIQGAFMFLTILYCLDDQSMNQQGHMIDIWFISITTYTCIILIVDLKLALHTKTWTWINWVAILIFSVGIYVLFVFVGDSLPNMFKSYSTLKSLVSSPIFYFLVAFFAVLVIYLDYISLIYEKEFSTPMRILFNSVMRRQQDNDPKIFESLVNNQKKELKKPML